MQFVELDSLGSSGELLELQSVEVFGTAARLLQQPIDGARVHVADIGRGLDRTAVAQTLDDPHDGRFGELGVPQECSLPLGEPEFAHRAVQAADVLVLASPLDDGKVTGVEAVETGAVGVRASERRQEGKPAEILVKAIGFSIETQSNRAKIVQDYPAFEEEEKPIST
jgi:hypothetical protein